MARKKEMIEHAISAENARLDELNMLNERLHKEYNAMLTMHKYKEKKIQDKIKKCYESIETGKKYIKNCEKELLLAEEN